MAARSIAINHTSYLDWMPAALAAHKRHRRLRFMIKQEMTEVKIVNFLIRHTGTIPVDRRAGAGAYAVAVDRLRAGELVAVYPEATISRSFELKEFKTGAARMAIDAQVPIIPLIVWGAQRRWTKDQPRKLVREKIPFTVMIGEPMPPADTVGQTDSAMREAMNALLHRAQESYEHPDGAYWVPRRLGGSAPTLVRGEGARRGRTGRARPQGTAGQVTPDLIASDVDGTLLDDEETITPRTRRAVLAAVDSGTRFVLATGRPPRWVQPVVDALGFAPMAVCANGAVIYDPGTDRILSARTLSADELGELAEIATRVIPGAGLAVERVGRSAHDAATPQFVSSPGYEHAWLNPDNTEVSVEDLLGAPAVKLLIRKAGARSSDMAAELAKHVGLQGDITYSTNNGLIEIVPLGISKATGVEEVARPYDISAEKVVAFGDMPNDIPMLRWAGLGVAMGNAHPEAIEAADEVTSPNSDDGLARVLERWWQPDGSRPCLSQLGSIGLIRSS